MPDPLVVLKAVAVAAIASALAGAVGRGFAKARSAGWVWGLAIGLGAYLGLAILGIRPRWPMREDQHRLLGLILPGVLVIEAVGGARGPRWWGRLAASLAVAPVILYGSVYVADLAGPGSAEWSPPRRWLNLSGLGLALFGVWSALAWTHRRAGAGIRTPLALAVAMAGAGPAVMLSGYASGGLIGPALAGAIVGAAVTAAWFRQDVPGVGVGVVGLFGSLMIGCFFGRLTTAAAVALFLGPLAAAIVDAAWFRRLSRNQRTAAGLALVVCVAGLVVALAARRFAADAGMRGLGP